MARVNGVPLTSRQMQLPFFLGQLPDGATAAQQDELVNRLIDRELIRQFLIRRKVTADPLLVDHQWTRICNLIEKKGEQVPVVLGRLHLDEASVKDYLSQSIAWQKYVRSIVTDAEIQQEWKQHRTEFDGTRVHLAEIFLPVAAGKDLVAVKHELTQLRSDLQEGRREFAQAARETSQGSSASEGGNLGEVEISDLNPVGLRETIGRSRTGEITEPVEGRDGWRLFQVLKVIPGQLSPEDARSRILQRISEDRWRSEVARLKQSARIERMPQSTPAPPG